MGRLIDLFPLILSALVLSVVSTPLAAALAKRVKLVDIPHSASHKMHTYTTPMGGGVVGYLTILLALLMLGGGLSPTVLGVLFGAGWLTVWGLWDDFREQSPGLKMLGQLLAVVILLLFDLRVRILPYTAINLFITFLWVIGMVNAFNFVDSMDGLLIGLTAAAAAFFMLVTIDSNQPDLARLSAVVLGTSIGLYYYNSSPARIFLGDSGSQLFGFVMAAVGLAYNPVGLEQSVSWFTPILVLGIPIFDATFVVLSRLRRRWTVYKASRDHTYHRLVGLGMAPARAVNTMHLAGILLGLLAFIALNMPPLPANSLFLIILLLGAVGVWWLDQPKPTT